MEQLQKELDRIRTRLTLLENKEPEVVYVPYPVYIPQYIPQPQPYFPNYPICQNNNIMLCESTNITNEYNNTPEVFGHSQLGNSRLESCQRNTGDSNRNVYDNTLFKCWADSLSDASYDSFDGATTDLNY